MRPGTSTVGSATSVVAMVLASLLCAGVPARAQNEDIRLVRTSIPMPDGVQLAATLYMPARLKPGERLPALLEYLPYRKDDDMATSDYGHHVYFAQHGYVGVRVDIRGFGNSGGSPPDREYSAQEQADGEQIIDWLSRQPWSNGKVGMLGISWGAFNSIQMAMRHPPALQAILAVEGTERLFTEDVHYMDGILHVDEFEVAMDLAQGISGAPDFPLDEATLARRMDSPPWSLDYFRHQRDGAFWQSPVRELASIRIPCFLIAGLQDGYRNSVVRMLEQVRAPVHALIGPWNHDFPNSSMYGPRIEWRDQAVRWFDHWLKGVNNGVESDPRVVFYQQHSHRPGAGAQDVPGEWRADTWPPKDVQEITWYLGGAHALSRTPYAPATDTLRYVPSAGAQAGFWWGELLGDQRPADAYSLVYESPVLPEPVAMMGQPRARLVVTASARLANWFVRLEDVAPDGEVTAITGAGQRGAQRTSLEHPEAMVPNQEYVLQFDLYLSSWTWEAGHRIRVSVSNAQWPMLWPTPDPMTTTLRFGGATGSSLTFPIIPTRGQAPPPFAQPGFIEQPPGFGTPGGDYAWPGTWSIARDENSARSTVKWRGTTASTYPWGRSDHSEQIIYHVDDAHPESADAEGEAETIQTLTDRVLTYRGHMRLTSDASLLHYSYTRELLRDGSVVRTRTWNEDIPRDLQ